MKTIFLIIISLISFPAFADWQVVQCKDKNSELNVKFKFTEGYVEVMGDHTNNGKMNSGTLASSQSEVSIYRGLTLYSQIFGWQETYEGNGLKDGEARLLTNGDETMLLQWTNEEGNLEAIEFTCEAQP